MTDTPHTEQGTPTPTEQATQAATVQSQTTGATAPVQQNGATPEIVMTNDNVPDWLPGRLEKAKTNAVKDFLSELGLDNPDTLKSMVSEYQELKQAQMSEAEKREKQDEKRKAEFEAMQAENETLKAQIAKSEQERLSHQRESIILNEFSQSPYARDILRLIRDEYKTDYEALLQDDGTPNDEIKERLVKMVSEKRGEWIRLSANPGSPSSSNRGYTAQRLDLTPEQLRERASKNRF